MASVESPVFGPDMKFVSPEVYDAFFAIIDRLEATIDHENAALAAQRHVEIPVLTRQKRQSFLELHRIMTALQGTIPSQDIMARLVTFRRKVEDNERVLQRHMRAVQTVANTIVRALQEIESDGTYSQGYILQRSVV